ncbi:MAG: Rqc2 family fibronectin-binding protein [Tissierella sp.]|uniref:Rqc2 family fibronectin-binding protein n=1 Tax=Tissierella sp. TaxID=41274 RepID=UPI003F9BDBDB
MSFDGIVTHTVVTELEKKLIGGRIDKIYQPEKDEIWIHIRSKGSNYKLLISATSNNPRIYTTKNSKQNPATPPMFCMLLRKHLIGGTILNIKQLNLDRVISIDISSLDELGDPTEKTLTIEIMGKHSNIIFVEKSNNKIIDSIKRVSFDMSRVRQILPGNTYIFPPSQDKLNPLLSNKEEFIKLLKNEKPNTHIYKFFYFNYMGLSPFISKEICFNANLDIKRNINSLSTLDIENLYQNFNNFISKIKSQKFNPLYIKDSEGKILAFYSLDIHMFGEKNKIFLPTISEVLDIVYDSKDTFDRVSQKSQFIKKLVQTKLDRSLNKLSKQNNELIESKDREKYKIYADLISANIHNINTGLKSVSLPNFYDENMAELSIPLDKKLSAPENAQRYYKRYSKLKSRESLLKIQIKETKDEIEYLENVLISIEHSKHIDEIEEIRDELIKEKYIRDTSKDKIRRKRKNKSTFKPHHYISTDGLDIYVGKNNVQNEYITLKVARKDDLWFHVQGMPGSHVIVKRQNDEIPISTLEEAATLAAFYSKAKNSSNVSVDYTDKKNVKKAPSSKTGMVIYNNFKTINITPSQGKIDKIKSVD